MKGAGVSLIILGVLLICGALLYQPTVETSGAYGLPQATYNLGKLQYQGLFFLGGVGAFIAGAMLFAVGVLIERLEQSGVLTPVPAPSSGPAAAGPAHRCDWCGLDIAEPVRPCASVDPDRLRDVAPRVRAPSCRVQLRERGFLAGEEV